ncbi:MAG: hypothetical protein JWM86_1596 [Thermoleophilia bacterium]|nr:hypothetical protein [Thermoleophilia bacterium]
MTDIAPLSAAAKRIALIGGGATGLAVGVGTQYLFPSPDRERELDAKGISTMSHREATATFAPIAFVGAAAVGVGLKQRSDKAAMTTVALGAAAMLASTGASAMVNAEEDSAEQYLRTLGLMTATAAAGFAVGATRFVPENRAKVIGLGMIGLAGGALLPETANYLGGIPTEVQRSIQHREG